MLPPAPGHLFIRGQWDVPSLHAPTLLTPWISWPCQLDKMNTTLISLNLLQTRQLPYSPHTNTHQLCPGGLIASYGVTPPPPPPPFSQTSFAYTSHLTRHVFHPWRARPQMFSRSCRKMSISIFPSSAWLPVGCLSYTWLSPGSLASVGFFSPKGVGAFTGGPHQSLQMVEKARGRKGENPSTSYKGSSSTGQAVCNLTNYKSQTDF